MTKQCHQVLPLHMEVWPGWYDRRMRHVVLRAPNCVPFFSLFGAPFKGSRMELSHIN